ncbi:limonene-1,2-epoxide hydrolase protein [Rhizobium sp. NXC14]|uniref:limonene-1,2-epoxide hydrolase family protein n=1 Tax=Rhizobium sp. NXC14 TaxID=1981173 RepID=UPI000A204131|nr:limonene-1,2-epoxide hydrolase family protein [Rhizobium sp. NXC14]ARO29105.1 limonene-1,2-epoxide hydrolase protein [Rhizobium sp. NXC14]
MSTDPTKTALTFFGHWNAGHIDEAIAMLSEEVLYDNVPLPNIIGRENVRKFHRDFGIGTTFTVDWTVTQIAAAGNVVLNERLDVFLHEGGGKIILPVMGTLTVVEGAITVWRDYFDPSDFDRQLALIGK